MPHPLELSYNWRTPSILASGLAALSIGLLATSAPTGWLTVAILIAAVWVGLMTRIALRTRAMMLMDGPILQVRRFHRMTRLDGRQLVRVQERLSPQGPCYRVWLSDREGASYVPAALLRKGHSTFFTWVLTWAPQADLDAGSLKTIERLRTRGLIE